jgi:3-deoxy-D-manno-octulosonic-acid transferase
MYQLYKLLSFIFYPLVRLLLILRVSKGKEDQFRYKEKLGQYIIKRPEGKLIWFHAASIGEFNAILPIIKSITTHNILVTTVTLTAAKIAESNLPSNAIHQFAPLDCVNIVKKFLKHWQPNLLIWTESELWPNMIALPKANIILLNARLSYKSYSRWKLIKPLANFILTRFNLILAQSQESKILLEKLGAKKVEYLGNLKFTAANFSFDPNEVETIKKQIKDRIVIMAASTHAGEEKMFKEVHISLKSKYPKLLSIIAPRHPERKASVLSDLEGLNTITRSSKKPITPEIDVLLIDTIGEFGLFFRLSEIVFTGGSWHKIGHSFIEPAKLDNLIIFGPNMNNSRELADEFINAKACLFAEKTEKIITIIEEYINTPKKFLTFKTNAKKILDKMTQVQGKIIKKIEPFLDKL